MSEEKFDREDARARLLALCSKDRMPSTALVVTAVINGEPRYISLFDGDFEAEGSIEPDGE